MISLKTFKLIGVGSPIIDNLARVDEAFVESIEGAKGGMELLNAGQIAELMARLEYIEEGLGGSAGNVAFTTARLGLPTTFLGKIGNDAGGGFYRERFIALGGDASCFKVGDKPNGRCLSLITPDSERTMRTHLGAAETLSPKDISQTDFVNCQHAHIEGYLLFNRTLMYKILDSAKAAGCSISLDLASFEVIAAANDILEDLLRDYVDIVFANEEEGATFTGLGDKHEDIVQVLGSLCPIAALKLGPKGSLILNKGVLHTVDPVKVPTTTDTTGAGDLWASGFLYGWLSGKPLPQCGQLASLLGAEAVQTIGTTISDDRWEAVAKEASRVIQAEDETQTNNSIAKQISMKP